ncbi:MAG: D-alanyl-D-alanine carboxypeptidase [Ruminiclostridium sp.]|nr:D-alanyl-D-alanine carboxypeptidase [Ruminiclostridium sp.]
MNRFKKITATALSAFITASMLMNGIQGEASASAIIEGFDPATDKVWSEAVYMVNIDTGDVVYEKNAEKKMFPASTTKIMTAIVALESVSDWEKKVEVPYSCFDEFWSGDPNKSDPSNAAIEPLQENLTYKDCIYALMLPSGCEAANILAYNICNGDMQAFFDKMNKKAKEIGCTGTNFSNAHGLHEEENYTTAKDMYLITRYAMENDRFLEVAGTYGYDMPANEYNPNGYSIYSTISLIRPPSEYYYEYAYGIKTGTTDQAGRCLVSAAKKQYNYVLVTLNAPLYDSEGDYLDEWYSMVDHINLYEWAFDNFAMTTIVEKTEQIKEIPVILGENTDHVIVKPDRDYTALMPKAIDANSVQKVAITYKEVTAPIKKGDILGVMDVKFKGENIVTVNLIASKDIKRSELDYYMGRINKELSEPWFIISVVCFVVLLICFIVTKAIDDQNRRKRRAAEKRRFENYAKKR